MFIIAEMRKDDVSPFHPSMPFVITSSHPELVPGTRIDWGYIQLMLKHGYVVTIVPSKD